MNIVILITSHRQLRELDFIPEFFKRHNYLRENSSIIYHTNNPEIPVSLIQEKLSGIDCKDILVRSSVQNSGYLYGNFEAIVDSYGLLLERNPDWVIKIHPDVFLVDELPLINLLKQAQDEGFPFVTSKMFGDSTPAFSADFFAFCPRLVPQSLFEIYQSYNGGTEKLGEEYLLFFEMKRQKIKHLVAERFFSGTYHRDIDALGLWHEHNLERVNLYLKNPSWRWLITAQRCLMSPTRSTSETLKYVKRKLKSEQQDSLLRRLTLI